MAQIDYGGREDVLGALDGARGARDWAEARRLGALDEEFQALHLSPKAWAVTARSTQEEALQFPRVLRSLWHDAPEVVEARPPTLPLRPVLAVCAAVLAGVLLWSGRGVFARGDGSSEVESREDVYRRRTAENYRIMREFESRDQSRAE